MRWRPLGAKHKFTRCRTELKFTPSHHPRNKCEQSFYKSLPEMEPRRSNRILAARPKAKRLLPYRVRVHTEAEYRIYEGRSRWGSRPPETPLL
ncbi:hypothetical protein AVEN_84933-1 [Araneus ventricosus]|uniref:Uncharacterized protein n=1 Tax=Araneus ventricosus TaxID=182803 RepID=A0A4Y2C0E3_ARAVE|nr:hypothetical protein AVEN_84933-1 [Araneus ventricosus]